MAIEAALAVMDIFEEENILEKSISLGNKLKSRFEAWQSRHANVGGIKGLTIMEKSLAHIAG